MVSKIVVYLKIAFNATNFNSKSIYADEFSTIAQNFTIF